MKKCVNIYQAFLLITSLIFLNSSCANGNSVESLSQRFVNLYEKDQNVSAKEFGNINENEKPEVLDYIVIHYLMGENSSKQNQLAENPIKFIHSAISILYPNLAGIINKHDWEILSKLELKELSGVTLQLFKKATQSYPKVYSTLQENRSSLSSLDSQATILMKVERYAVESAVAYLSKLFKSLNRNAAKAFIINNYLNNDSLLNQLVDKFIELKGNKTHKIDIFNLYKVFEALNEQSPSQILKELTDTLKKTSDKLYTKRTT